MRVAILGCGYVGCALARRLAGDHAVVGVRRSNLEAVRATGADAVRADVTDAATLEAVPDVDTLVFLASSGGRDAASARGTFVEGLRTVIGQFGDRRRPPDRLVYSSSTGVYGDHGGAWVDETTPPGPDTDRDRVLLAAERVATTTAMRRGIDGTVARLAGLYGPERYRIDRYLEGPVEPGYLNLIHRADAAGAIAHLIAARSPPSHVLVVDDEPVDRRVLADWVADQLGVDRSGKNGADGVDREARSPPTTGKRCANDRLHNQGYELVYPTFRDGYREAVRSSR